MQKILKAAGKALVVVGLIRPWIGKIPLGRLPGGIRIFKR
ncbi:MAG: DUF2905 family protein [Syntrophobacteraceae bacterium]|nr:DUF2905 family protein [Syntrophobacteraceae bacterium]